MTTEHTLSREKFAELGRYYRKHLLEETLPFWEKRIRDDKNGGYFTSFDMAGNVSDPIKSIWGTGRMVWMFSALYNRVEKRKEWLDLARHGRDFLVKHAYAGGGRWFYKLDLKGNMVEGTVSAGSDLFTLLGLAEYAAASGSREDLQLIEETWGMYERMTRDPDPRDVDPSRPFYKGRPMFEVHLADVLAPVLGAERTRFSRDRAIEKILWVYSKDEHKANFECLDAHNKVVDTPRGRTLNPGHTMEALWFCMDAARKTNDRRVIERAAQVADWTWNRGWDKEYGGLFAYLDLNGQIPTEKWGYHLAVDQAWDDKSWWVHCESLVTFAMAAVETRSETWMQRFMELHDYCREKFYARQYGEWWPSLHRDGRPKMTDHGKAWKWAYHLPRALMYLMQILEDAAKSGAPARRKTNH